MCGIAGWINNERNINGEINIMENMTDMLKRRGPDDRGFYVCKNALLGHRRLVIVDPEGGRQPMTRQLGDNKYTIVYNGELYNTEEVREKLKAKGHKFEAYSDTEVLLVSYMEWGEDCLKHINGIFAFGVWDEKNKSLFLGRDPLGVKPLFYTHKNHNLIFGSEIKALLEHPMVEPVIDREGLLEIFGLGPARSLGSGVFKYIKEIPPGNYLVYRDDTLVLKEYWKLEAKDHEEDMNTTVDHTRSLLIDAIERQLVSDVPVCTFLSGGLDSSAISAITANYFKRNKRGILNTFSIAYEDNDKYFKANEYQPNSDDIWAEKMAKFINSNHHNIAINNLELARALKDAVKASDLPGMADIDSSLYLFCKEVRKKSTVALSGECADEIFGGYPWYRREADINANTFPWSKHVKERRNILAKGLKNLPLEEYVAQKYEDTLKQVPKIKGETAEEARMRELFYLNMKWFMVTLLNRKDRMSMANSLEVRVPFADYRLVEYAFNIPNEMKFCDGREKGLLRRALKGILPKDIIERKKSPYPKTHHSIYTEAVQRWMGEILKDKNSPILEIIDRDKVYDIVKTGGKSFTKPWFGQLMTGPQMIAYLIQMDTWMREYKVKIIE
ncbi:MAG: asparagine synthase (glutamine-hydrolyzing) [Anaeromicrobium sp.]|jgi:asparagine synthase (glutamine-hydrolysing)|uniref:asparagine synthase (glutamine-hydrolyzing) n=1 Tax=Anaeromicrobium sp. TaxID=1929132 RepID=UPI0025D69B16|nr:asparagine synthase (glutamine-hydrolyzing) [Anaeromicrobium sp.]MCT4594132.1 asparagine synthase (glutamine-hydrolyzing) [Anaeromicrobium sp.]